MLTGGHRLAVWGDPIEHSLSPVLHSTAYRLLGLDWSYGRRRVDESSFGDALASLGPDERGLSLTMPLKVAAHRAAATRDRFAELSGAVNTLLLTPGGPHGFNTDVPGIAADIRFHGIAAGERARIVGAGATATSALLALSVLGCDDVEVAARRPAAAQPLTALGEQIGVAVRVVPIDAARHTGVPLTVAALPGGAEIPPAVAEALAADGGTLYDVVYGHWPTALAQAWDGTGRPAVHGRGMLVEQALRQVRVFFTGDVDRPLPDEGVVLAAMRAVVTEA